MTISPSLLSFAVPGGIALLWITSAPWFVSALNPRLAERNRDHFAKLVRFSRAWGVAAIAAGVVVGKLL